MSFQIVVEGIQGQSDQGTMAIDDVQLSSYPCTGPGHCDFEVNMCSWRYVIGEDDTDWLRQQGNSRAPSTGPSVDHTTNSSIGKFNRHLTCLIKADVYFCKETQTYLQNLANKTFAEAHKGANLNNS